MLTSHLCPRDMDKVYVSELQPQHIYTVIIHRSCPVTRLYTWELTGSHEHSHEVKTQDDDVKVDSTRYKSISLKKDGVLQLCHL